MKERICPRCAPVGHLKKQHLTNGFVRRLRPLVPFRRYACDSCQYKRWMWTGFHGRMESDFPVMLIIIFVFICILVGWFIGRH